MDYSGKVMDDLGDISTIGILFWDLMEHTKSDGKSQLVGGIPTPLKNDGVRQLGSLFPIYGKIIQSCSSHHQPDHHFLLVKSHEKSHKTTMNWWIESQKNHQPDSMSWNKW